MLAHGVENCTIPVYIGHGSYTVPVVYETLRRRDPLKDCARCSDAEMAADDEHPALSIGVLDAQKYKPRVSIGCGVDEGGDSGRNRSRRLFPSHEPHIPPPVTAPDAPPPPAGATKVPEPVSVMVELSSACADANPPASKI